MGESSGELDARVDSSSSPSTCSLSGAALLAGCMSDSIESSPATSGPVQDSAAPSSAYLQTAVSLCFSLYLSV